MGAAASVDRESAEQRIMLVFEKIDLNNSGNIDASELGACLRGAGNAKFEAALLARDWLAKMDGNGDQKINVDEFKAFFARTLEEYGSTEAEKTLLFFEEAADIQVAWTQTSAKTSMQVKEERAADAAAQAGTNAEAPASRRNDANGASSSSSSSNVNANSSSSSCGDEHPLGATCSLATRGAYLLSLDAAGVAEQVDFVKATLKEREKHRKRDVKAKVAEANLDYSKTVSGTLADTTTEKAFTELMKEMDGKSELPEDPFADTLRVITARDWPEGHAALRAHGRWLKVEVIHADGLPGVGYIHALTCEEDFRKPEDYVEEAAAEVAEDPYAGLKSCDMEDISEWILACITGSEDEGTKPRTPLLIDTSEDRKMATFFKYKGVVVELEPLSWSRKKQSAEKVVASKAMEEARRRAVIAMKHGKTLCLDLGAMGSGSNFVEVFCKEHTLPEMVFEEGGQKMVRGKPQPFCKKMWKEGERTPPGPEGMIVIDPDFKVVVLTSHAPSDAMRELTEPLGTALPHLEPVVVVTGNG